MPADELIINIPLFDAIAYPLAEIGKVILATSRFTNKIFCGII